MPDIADIRNPAKERLEAGELALGLIVRLARSGDVARLAKSSGLDFVFIDIQHAIYSLETISHIAQAALGCGITAMVRMRSCRDPDVSVLLDGGVTGIVFPDVNTADDARAGVNACKYAPIGRRSATCGLSAVRFQAGAAGAGDLHHEQEHPGGVHDRDAGRPRQCRGDRRGRGCRRAPRRPHRPAHQHGQARRAGRSGGHGGGGAHRRAPARRAAPIFGVGGDTNLERQKIYIELGSQFIPTQSDGAFLMAGATRAAGDLRALKA